MLKISYFSIIMGHTGKYSSINSLFMCLSPWSVVSIISSPAQILWQSLISRKFVFRIQINNYDIQCFICSESVFKLSFSSFCNFNYYCACFESVIF